MAGPAHPAGTRPANRRTVGLRPAGSGSAVADLGRALLVHLEPLTQRQVEAILAADPSYCRQGALSRSDLERSCRDNLRRQLQTLTGELDAEDEATYDAPRATGHRRAEQGVPLESVLHAYRIGFRTIWEGLVEQARAVGTGGVDHLVEAATEVWELVDRFSSSMADSYRRSRAEIERRDSIRRGALLDALLDGRGAERAVAAEATAALGLPEHGRFVVVVLQGGADLRAVDALAVRGLRAAWRTREDREVGVVSLGRGCTEEVLAALRVVHGTRAGVSPAVDGLAELAVGHRLAETALRALPRGEAAVAELDARLPGALLVTSPDLAGRLVRRALGRVLDLDADERELLLETLTAWLATGGSASQTATRLYCHRNTVLNRLRRLEGLTGRSVERVDDLVEWSLALLALQVLPAPQELA